MNQQPALATANDQRLRRLIATGYFPAELPPPFTTRSFARHSVDLAKLWDGAGIRRFWTAPEHFSIPRYNQVRRKLSIVNPINQLHVAQLISDNWDEIKLRLERSRITEFHPEIVVSGGGRAVTGVNFDGVSRRRAEILASYGRYVKTDIARFYPSVYTHSIAWAMLGKDWVKQNLNTNAFKTSFSNRIDKAIAAGQSGQTIGIPIGPDTSRIVSELIATDLEVTARRAIPDLEQRAVRYVDDLIVGLEDSETSDAILAKLSAALYEYELDLNADKTAVHGIGFGHSPEWVHFIRSFDVSIHVGRQREDLDSFFEQALHLADANPRENVLLFAAKRAATFKIQTENWNHLVRWFLYISRRSSTCLSFVVQHLSVSHVTGTFLPLDEVRTYIHRQLPSRAEAAHTAEVAWLIFWARELGVTLEPSVLERAVALRSSACALLVLDMITRGLIAGKLDTSFWEGFSNANGLKSEMWLVSYEATRKAWWPKSKGSAYITSHPYFAELWSRDVQFYESARKSRPQVGPSFFQMLRAVSGTASVSSYPD